MRLLLLFLHSFGKRPLWYFGLAWVDCGFLKEGASQARWTLPFVLAAVRALGNDGFCLYQWYWRLAFGRAKVK